MERPVKTPISFVAIKYVDGIERDSFFLNIPRNTSLDTHMQRRYHVSFNQYTESRDTYLGVGIQCTWIFESGNVVFHLVDYRFEE